MNTNYTKSGDIFVQLQFIIVRLLVNSKFTDDDGWRDMGCGGDMHPCPLPL